MVIQISSRRRAVGATARDVTIDGVRLAYDDEGQGLPIVCLHAIGHGAGDFAALRRRFGDRHRVIALDWPGHGSSADDREPASPRRYGDLLRGFLEALAIDPAIVVGNSIGGAAAIRLAAGAPERVRALVLANPGGLDRGGGTTMNRLVTRAMASFFAAGERGARWYPRAFGAYYRIVLTESAAAEQRARIIAQGSDVAGVLAEAWRSFGEPEADVRPLVASIACPVLFAWAERDRINQLGRCRAAIDRFPNARLETFRAGHAAFLEAPEAFFASFERFLGEVAGPPGFTRAAPMVTLKGG